MSNFKKLALVEAVSNLLEDPDLTVTIGDYKSPTNGDFIGLSIQQDGHKEAKCIHVDELLEMIDRGVCTIDEAAHHVVTYYEKKEELGFDPGMFTNKEFLLSHTYFDVMSQENAMEFKEKAPHFEFLNLTVFFRVCITNGETSASVFITDENMKVFGITFDELMQHAKENNQNGLEIKPLVMVIRDIAKKEGCPCYFPSSRSDKEDLWYITNTNAMHGAIAILNNEALQGLADYLEQDLIIYPYSVYEIIIRPSEIEEMNGHDNEMIRIVNASMDKSEVLSDTSYRFIRSEGKLVVNE